MLLRRESRRGLPLPGYEPQPLSLDQGWQLPFSLVLRLLIGLGTLRSKLGILSFQIDRRVSREPDHCPCSPKQIRIARLLGHAIYEGDVQDGRDHLRSNEAVPNQFVKLVMIAVEVRSDILWISIGRCGPNGFMGLLGSLLRLIDIGRRREVLSPEPLLNHSSRFLGRLSRDAR